MRSREIARFDQEADSWGTGWIRWPVGRGMLAMMSPTNTSWRPTNHSGGAIITARDWGSSHTRFIRDTTWVSVRWYQPGGPLTAEQVGQQYLSIVLGGITREKD